MGCGLWLWGWRLQGERAGAGMRDAGCWGVEVGALWCGLITAGQPGWRCPMGVFVAAGKGGAACTTPCVAHPTLTLSNTSKARHSRRAPITMSRQHHATMRMSHALSKVAHPLQHMQQGATGGPRLAPLPPLLTWRQRPLSTTPTARADCGGDCGSIYLEKSA